MNQTAVSVQNNTPPIRFGTGGWRAVIGYDFICPNIRRIAYAVACCIENEQKKDTPVIIGYDRRFLSDAAARWIAEVFAAAEIPVLFLRRSAPTPLIMHTVLKNRLYYGIEVTASHNPSNYNGIKLIVEEGRDAPIELTEQLEQDISAQEGKEIPWISFEDAVKQGKITFLKNPFNAFIDDILKVIDTDAIREHDMRILFDPMHGSAIYPMTVILSTARCTLDLINDRKDAYFGGIMPAPSQTGVQDLVYQLRLGDYDLGIAVDGDGDRLGIIDKNGRYITANEVLVLLYYYLHEYKGWKGPVVRNLATTHMLDVMAKDFGEVCYEVPVGFKWISAKIDEVDAILGGESSGGLTVRGHIHGKDSIYAAALFVEMLCRMQRSPSEILDELKEKYGSFEMVEDNLTFAKEQKEQIHRIVFEQKQLPVFSAPIQKVSYRDGCKVYFKDNSFIICRFSGTEPLLRIFAEASTPEVARGYIDAFRKMLCL